MRGLVMQNDQQAQIEKKVPQVPKLNFIKGVFPRKLVNVELIVFQIAKQYYPVLFTITLP